ncbi:MAG: hypothetical protein Kow0031_09630 [Anaerolineae bacterium]
MVLPQRDQLHLDPDGKTLRMLVETPKTKSQHFACLAEETTGRCRFIWSPAG